MMSERIGRIRRAVAAVAAAAAAFVVALLLVGVSPAVSASSPPAEAAPKVHHEEQHHRRLSEANEGADKLVGPIGQVLWKAEQKPTSGDTNASRQQEPL